MANKGHSDPNLFGGYTHYDEKGNKIGRSEPGLFGGYTNYDANGKKIGHSDPGLFGGYINYDNNGKKIGRSDPGLCGGYIHYDANGKKIGDSSPQLFGGYSHSSGDACYVATCVYGSYDCPEVWTLRRFRDGFLKRHTLGRAFIRLYYAVSPKIVAHRGEHKTFRTFWKSTLNAFVAHLNARGYSDAAYFDDNK
ncbi:MAG: hypothetical protein K5756_08120 [Clostridiales bacterium]|nr:hypothetical protein [Clostridiales bacterium]